MKLADELQMLTKIACASVNSTSNITWFVAQITEQCRSAAREGLSSTRYTLVSGEGTARKELCRTDAKSLKKLLKEQGLEVSLHVEGDEDYRGSGAEEYTLEISW